MAFTELETAAHKRLLNAWLEKNRPPPHIRPKVDFGYRIKGQSVEFFEIRLAYQRLDEKQEAPIAKATWVKTQASWNVYWQRADLKWHGYEPVPQVESLERFLTVVMEDQYCCFFG